MARGQTDAAPAARVVDSLRASLKRGGSGLREPALKRLLRTFAFTALVACITSIVTSVIVQNNTAQVTTLAKYLSDSGLRQGSAVNVYTLVQGMALMKGCARRSDDPRPPPPHARTRSGHTPLSEAAYNRSSTELDSELSVMQTLHGQLYATATDNFVDLRDTYVDPMWELTYYMGGVGEKKKADLVELVLQYEAQARLVATTSLEGAPGTRAR